jgi:hypothetical protein
MALRIKTERDIESWSPAAQAKIRAALDQQPPVPPPSPTAPEAAPATIPTLSATSLKALAIAFGVAALEVIISALAMMLLRRVAGSRRGRGRRRRF